MIHAMTHATSQEGQTMRAAKMQPSPTTQLSLRPTSTRTSTTSSTLTSSACPCRSLTHRMVATNFLTKLGVSCCCRGCCCSCCCPTLSSPWSCCCCCSRCCCCCCCRPFLPLVGF